MVTLIITITKKESEYCAKCTEVETSATGSTPEQAIERLKEITQEHLEKEPFKTFLTPIRYEYVYKFK